MITRSIILIMLLTICVIAENPWREGEMEVKVNFKNEIELNTLYKFDFMGDIYNSSGFANLYVIPQELKQLNDAGFDVVILEADLKGRAKRFWNSRDLRADYMTYNEIIALMDNLVNNYPDICSKTVFGESVEGRELSALKISDNVDIDEPEPEILFDGGIHGDELGGPENIARFAKFLCEEYGNNSTISDLIDSREIWLYCMVNPDGRVYVSRENANEADLNRNWGYMWNGECYTNSGFSQPETKAVRNCLLENQFSIQVSNHSGIEAIFLPWCYTSSVSPEYNLHESLSNVYLSTSDYGSFEICQSNHDYATTGETVDFAYGVMGTAALTMELSSQKQPSNSTSIYDKNESAMIEMINSSGDGIEGFITDKNTGFPVAARLYFNDSYPSYNDPEVGDYHRYLNSGSYNIRVEANGYKRETVNSVTISHGRSSASMDIELEPDSSNSVYGYKVVYLKKCVGYSYNALGKKDGEDLSLGNNGVIIIDMQFYLNDNPANDLTVYSTSSNSYQCYVSTEIDGPWINIGNGTGESEFDFDGLVSDSIRYVKISGSNVKLDAIEAKIDKATNNVLMLKNGYLQPKVLLSKNQIIISGLSNAKSEVKLFNALGQVCLKKNIESNKAFVEIHKFSSGVYFVQVRNGIHQFCKKISVSK